MYNLHVEVIKLLQYKGDRDQLRSSRERMSAVYPLTEGVRVTITSMNESYVTRSWFNTMYGTIKT